MASLTERRGCTLYEVYEDQDVSGTKGRRPGLDRLLADARRRRFDVLVVWRSDRLFRSVHHTVVTLTNLDALGIDFVSVTEACNTSTPTGKLLFHICCAFGQFERDVIIERTLAGMAAARRRGAAIGRPRVRIDLARAHDLRRQGLGLGPSSRRSASVIRVASTRPSRSGPPRPEVSSPSNPPSPVISGDF
jgi:DNA invertase Pin-like site-specific DNA recombinase